MVNEEHVFHPDVDQGLVDVGICGSAFALLMFVLHYKESKSCPIQIFYFMINYILVDECLLEAGTYR